MAKRLADNRDYRAMTVESADALFRDIALVTVRREKIRAGYEKRLAELKAAAGRELDPIDAEIRELTADLTGYITANPERFVKPRQHQTDYGKYGFRSVSNLEIVDETLAVASVKAQAVPALVVTEKLDKKALEKSISDGINIDGVEMRRGEIVSYTVAKSLMEE